MNSKDDDFDNELDDEEPVYLSLDSAVPLDKEPDVFGYLANDPKKLFALDTKALEIKTHSEGNQLIEDVVFRAKGCKASDVQVICIEERPELMIVDRIKMLEYICRYTVFN